ncbi:patatin-like phospholipase family protein [Pricia sp. S334]|uniref:Patatin-like phospholipase family protein n=1 Tax=Pricia mediterranea TaxID=3076079 RepID=A0ABU3L7C0_9FLAO|nr:patatin-like phospholipase family protein [Pricia sp. S334]MDT7829074.1 patatin-like phospholipase family protein [Pricia sp. S334]
MKYCVVLLVVLLGSGIFAFGQVGDSSSPKVGLVLSGGGAKGLAHIGALKVIEEAGVKIDYIGGTSMGAIVGALYAAGYTATELDSIFRTTDFTNLIDDNLPRSAKTFYEKEDSERYAVTLPFSKFKISVPSAYSGGQNVYNELVKLLYPVKNITDFDKLPIPFLCIATDVENGEEVILKEGYLPQAVMASGALPSLFEPVKADDRLLIDGGVVNNYPIEKVKNMGADVIIGVDVQHGLRDREGLISATEILLQINNYRTVNDMVEKSEQTDVYIKPEIDKFSVIDFNLAARIIESGAVAAKKSYGDLRRLAKMQGDVKGQVPVIKPVEKLTIDHLTVTGSANYPRGYVKGKLRLGKDGETTFSKLEQGVGNLAATRNFKTIHYKLKDSGGEQELILDLTENPVKTFVRIGAHYDDLYKTAAILNVTRKQLLTRDDVASFDFIIGDNVRYNFQYYVDKGSYWSFGLNSRFNDFRKEIDFDLIRGNYEVPSGINLGTINLDVSDFTNRVYVETVLREEFAYRMGVEHKLLKYSTRTLGQLGEDEVRADRRTSDGKTYFENSNFYSVFGKLTLDTYDDAYFPSKGLYFDGDFHFYLLSSDFNDNFKEFSVAKARMGGAVPISKYLSLNIETEGGFKLGTSDVTSFDFILGGFGTDLINNNIPFFGYDFISLPGNSFVKAYGRLDYEFWPKNHLMFTANFSNVDDDIFRTGEWFTLPDYSGYGIGYGWESFLGPLQVHYSWSPEGKTNNFFFSLGYWF